MSDTHATTALGAGIIPLDPTRTRYTLDSGCVVDMVAGTGKHMRLAYAVSGGSNDQLSQTFALVSVLCRYDGRDLTYEDVDALPLDDVAEMISIVRGARLSDAEKAAAEKAAAEKAAAERPADPKGAPEPEPEPEPNYQASPS